MRLRTLGQALSEAAATREGMTFTAGTAHRSSSYAELRDSSLRVATSLAKAGFTRGDLIALIVSDARQFLAALFGTSLAGMVPASIHPPSATGDIGHYLATISAVLASSRARAVIADPQVCAAIETLRATHPDLAVTLSAETVETGDAPARVSDGASLDDVAFVQFTSGATSQPKGVMVTHRSLAANIEAINGPEGLATSSSDSAVSWLPLYHDMGLIGMALGALYAGRPAVLMTPDTFVRRPAEWLRAISRHRATVSFAPNFAYDLCVRRVKAADLGGLDLSCWRIAGCGGEPIHAATLSAFADKFAAVGFRRESFLPSYGLAEHVLAATFPPRGRGVRTNRVVKHGEVVSCGSPLPGHRLRIVDDTGAAAPDRCVGEITLAGPSVMQGYLGDANATASTLRDGWLHTGDLGFLAGGELFVCGRLKEVLIVNGRKYHPQDLEWAIDELPGVRRGRVAAFGIPQIGAADRVVIVVEPSGAVDGDALVRAVRSRIVDVTGLFADQVLLVPTGTIDRTTSGKTRRLALRQRYERGEL